MVTKRLQPSSKSLRFFTQSIISLTVNPAKIDGLLPVDGILLSLAKVLGFLILGSGSFVYIGLQREVGA